MNKQAFVTCLLVMTLSATAHADVPNEPCEGKDEGDTCELDDGGQGVCDAEGSCVAESDAADDDGCSVSRVGTRVAAGAFSAAALAGVALVARRRRKA